MWKVMIADDEPFIREGIEQLIPWKELGCRLVYCASNGRELIEHMEQELPDIVIVDIKMPVLGGLDVAKYIQDNRLDIHVIILTAYADFQYAHQAIRYNASDYIVKSSALEEIPKAIERITEKLQDSRLAGFRMILLQGTAEEEMLSKMTGAAFGEFEWKKIEANQGQNYVIITGNKLSEEEAIESACKKIQGLYRNFLQKNMAVGISQIFYDSRHVDEYMDKMKRFVREQMLKNGPDIFWQEKENGMGGSQPGANDMDELIKRVNDYLEDNFCNRVSLDDIAAAVHTNRSYLSRVYKQKTGLNLFDTINMKRLLLAKKLIGENEKKMYEIAVQVGFEDTAYFSKVFKKFEGISPKEYFRKSCMEKEAQKEGGRGAEESKAVEAKKTGAAIRFTLLFFLCLCSCSLTSCQKKTVVQTEITLMHGWGAMDPDHVTMRGIYEDFERENPDVKINLVSMPSSEAVIDKANDMLSVGKIPDIIFTGGYGKDSFYQFIVEKGYAVDFMPFIQSDTSFAADLGPEIQDYWKTEEGKLFSVSDVLLLSGGYWYNLDIFKAAGVDKVPETWSEFFTACDDIKQWADEGREDVIPLQVNVENGAYLVNSLILKEGGEGAQALLDKRLEIQKEEFSSVLGNLKEVYQYSYDTNETYGYRDASALFNEGRLAMYINGVWANQGILPELNVGYATLPSLHGESVSCVSACLGFVVGNTGDLERINASVRFVKYMVSDRVQKRILEETGQVPSNPAVKESDYSQEAPRLFQAVQTVQGADIKLEVPDNLWQDEKMNLFQENIMGVLRGEIQELDFIDSIQ